MNSFFYKGYPRETGRHTLTFSTIICLSFSSIFILSRTSPGRTRKRLSRSLFKIWEKRDTLLSIRSFESYLFRMAKNKLIDLLAKRKLLRNVHMQYAGIRGSFHTEPEQSTICRKPFPKTFWKIKKQAAIPINMLRRQLADLHIGYLYSLMRLFLTHSIFPVI